MSGIEGHLAAIAEGAAGLSSYDEAFDLLAEAHQEMRRRGSRARYRKAVEMEIARWTGAMWAEATKAARAGAADGLESPGARRHRDAIRRARRILAALDAGRPGGAS